MKLLNRKNVFHTCGTYGAGQHLRLENIFCTGDTILSLVYSGQTGCVEPPPFFMALGHRRILLLPVHSSYIAWFGFIRMSWSHGRLYKYPTYACDVSTCPAIDYKIQGYSLIVYLYAIGPRWHYSRNSHLPHISGHTGHSYG